VGKFKPVLAVVLAISAACTSGIEDNGALRAEITRVGDTTVVLNRGEPAHVRRDSIRLLWRSAALQDPSTLLRLGDRLIVGDAKRVHIVSLQGEFLRTVGREGHGPREFEHIAEVAQFAADTVAVHDVENQRITFFTPNGDFLGSARYEPLLPYGNPVNGYLPETSVRRGLVRFRDGVVSLWRERVSWTRATRTALVWHDLQADTAAVLESWEGERWFRAGGQWAGTTELFPPRVIAALAPDGRLAVGNGIGYCITRHVVMQGEFRRVCRDRTPAPVGEGIHHPDWSRVESEFMRRARSELARDQRVPRHLPHFDRLLIDEEGHLWVRTIGPEFSDLHPYLLESVPDIRPPFRTWDVFDEAGRLLSTIEIPSNFEPQVIQQRSVYGFVELQSGEVAVGVMGFPF
jgi:hypothetical protein